MGADSPESERRSPTSPIQWVTAASGGLVLIAILGYLVWYGVTHPEGSPVITVTTEEFRGSGDGYLVEFAVRNDGSATAAGVVVSGTLSDRDGTTLETSRAEIDYLPQQSQRRGGLVFTEDPTSHPLSIRVEGFAYP